MLLCYVKSKNKSENRELPAGNRYTGTSTTVLSVVFSVVRYT